MVRRVYNNDIICFVDTFIYKHNRPMNQCTIWITDVNTDPDRARYKYIFPTSDLAGNQWASTESIDYGGWNKKRIQDQDHNGFCIDNAVRIGVFLW
jgi:hypothetical protein